MEFIATGAETLGKLGSDSVSGVEFLRISLYFPADQGPPPPSQAELKKFPRFRGVLADRV
jgi:hypothetical protein